MARKKSLVTSPENMDNKNSCKKSELLIGCQDKFAGPRAHLVPYGILN